MLKTSLLCIACVCALTVPAAGDNLFPPAWAGGPLSYEADWAFTAEVAGTAGILPDIEVLQDDADPATYMYQTPSTIALDTPNNWLWTNGTLKSIAPTNGVLTWTVRNWVDLLPLKLIRVQIKYAGVQPQLSLVEAGNGDGPILNLITHDPVVSAAAPFLYQDFEIEPNPDWEAFTITVPNGTAIDQLYIHTRSVPEPAALALLVLGGFALLRHRR